MNWPDYDRGLVRRGDIRFWIDESALEQWDAAKRRTPGGQRRFSELAISTTLMLGMVFRLPLRQTEGFVRSLVDVMGCDLPVPDHTTLSRRRRTVDVVVETSTNKWPTDIVLDSTGLKFFGAGEWARAKHGETRRSWRKLHISVDPASSEIRTHELTGDDTADATMAGPLVAGSGGMIRRVFADGAYDGEPVTKAIREARPPNSPPEIIIPPRATSIPPPDTPHGGSEREHHAAEIASKGRMNWQKRQGYGLRALGETAMARVKRLNGGKLTARTFQSQQTEIAMQIDALNRSIRAAKTKHNQDPLTNRGMGDHTIAAPCTKAPWNETMWKHPRFNMLLNEARGELDFNKAREMYWEMQKILHEEGSTVIPVFADELYAHTDKLTHGKIAANWEMDGYHLIERWWFK